MIIPLEIRIYIKYMSHLISRIDFNVLIKKNHFVWEKNEIYDDDIEFYNECIGNIFALAIDETVENLNEV